MAWCTHVQILQWVCALMGVGDWCVNDERRVMYVQIYNVCTSYCEFQVSALCSSGSPFLLPAFKSSLKVSYHSLIPLNWSGIHGCINMYTIAHRYAHTSRGNHMHVLVSKSKTVCAYNCSQTQQTYTHTTIYIHVLQVLFIRLLQSLYSLSSGRI